MKFLKTLLFWEWRKRLRCHGSLWACDKTCAFMDDVLARQSKKTEEKVEGHSPNCRMVQISGCDMCDCGLFREDENDAVWKKWNQ